MITKAVDKSEQDELYGYEVKQVSLEELKNKYIQLKAEYKRLKEQNKKQQTELQTELQNIKKQKEIISKKDKKIEQLETLLLKNNIKF